MRWRRCSTSIIRARRASGFPTALAGTRIWTRSRSCANSTRRLCALSWRHYGRRGVDRLAGRVASDVRRRTRLRLQMEHGLDARHALVHAEGAVHRRKHHDRDDVRDHLRVYRKFRAGAVARRSGARQVVAAAEDERRSLAAIRDVARVTLRSCGRIRARSCCSWDRSSHRVASGISWLGSIGRAGRAWHRGVQALVRDCNASYRRHPALHDGDCIADRIPLDRRRRRAAFGFRLAALRRRGRTAGRRDLQFHGGAARGFRIGLPLPGRWREILNTDAAMYGGSNVGNAGESSRATRPVTAFRVRRK